VTNTQALIDAIPAAVKEGRTTERRVDGAFALGVTGALLGFIALICTIPYGAYMSFSRTNWLGGAYAEPVKWTLQQLLSDGFFWFAMIGTLLPLAASAIALVFGARYRIDKVLLPAGLGAALALIAFLGVLDPSLKMLG
jgi:uncharacterized membrane protein